MVVDTVSWWYNEETGLLSINAHRNLIDESEVIGHFDPKELVPFWVDEMYGSYRKERHGFYAPRNSIVPTHDGVGFDIYHSPLFEVFEWLSTPHSEYEKKQTLYKSEFLSYSDLLLEVFGWSPPLWEKGRWGR